MKGSSPDRSDCEHVGAHATFLDDSVEALEMMTWPFQRGRTYNRRQNIHASFGGQQQGGIITPAGHPLIILITGKKGLDNGYVDLERDDGIFEYVGEGQVGPMVMNKGNRAVVEHSAAGKSLLLFEKANDGMLGYKGEYVCAGYRVEQKPDRNRDLRDAFVFELCPLEGIAAVVDDVDEDVGNDLDLMRARALQAAQTDLKPTQAMRNVLRRSRYVRSYVLARAKGFCEGCSLNAPFKRPDGSGYLEPHHLRRVSDGGPDHPDYVIALCPNCHRRVHLGADGPAYNDELVARMPQLVRATRCVPAQANC